MDLRRDGVMRWQFACISVEDQVRPQGGGGGLGHFSRAPA